MCTYVTCVWSCCVHMARPFSFEIKIENRKKKSSLSCYKSQIFSTYVAITHTQRPINTMECCISRQGVLKVF